jgi:hypothetical protein
MDLFPERKAKDPGWFQAKELELAGLLVAVRNAAFERYWSLSAETRGRLGNSAVGQSVL